MRRFGLSLALVAMAFAALAQCSRALAQNSDYGPLLPAAPRPSEAKPSEVKPSEVKPSEVKPAEATWQPEPVSGPLLPVQAAAPKEEPKKETVRSPLCIEKIGPATQPVGKPLVYEIVVRNTHGAAVRGVRLQEELPAKCRVLHAEPKPTGSSPLTLPSAPGGEGKVREVWELGTLEPGAERRIKLEVQPAEPGDFTACASVTFTAEACLTTLITRPRLEIVKTGPENVRLGDVAVFRVKVTNVGNGPAYGVVIHDDLPDGLQHPGGPSIDAEIGTLAPGESKEIKLEAKAVKPGSLRNKASAEGENTVTVTAEAPVLVTESALALKKSGPATRFLNREAEFTIEISNPGTAASTNVRVHDQLPEGLDFLEASDGGTFDARSRRVTWVLGTVAPGARHSLRVKVFGRSPGDYVNQATVQGDRGLEAIASAPLRVEGVPALLLEVVDLDDPVEVGSETIYEIRVLNQGTNPCTGLRILAIVPDGMTPVRGEGAATAHVQGQQVIFDPVAKLAPRADALFRVRVRCQRAGDWRFKAQMSCDQFTLPVFEEESTRTYKD